MFDDLCVIVVMFVVIFGVLGYGLFLDEVDVVYIVDKGVVMWLECLGVFV